MANHNNEALRTDVTQGMKAASDLVRRINEPPEDEAGWGQDIELAERSLRLLDLVRSSLDLASAGRYRASFVLARAHFEHEMLDRLMLLATERDVTLTDATEGQESALKKRDDIQNLRWSGKGAKNLTFRWIPPPIESEDSPDEFVSPYYLASKEFRPGYVAGVTARRVLPTGLGSVAEQHKYVDEQKALYGQLFKYPSIVGNLALNNLVSEFEEAQIAVHYAFLSVFAHGFDTSGRFEASPWRPSMKSSDGAVIEELLLLYAAKTTQLALEAWLTYVDERSRFSWLETASARRESQALDHASSHLWFRGGAPCKHDFDDYQRWLWWGKDSKEDQLELDPEHGIPYYSAPLARLKRVVAMGRT